MARVAARLEFFDPGFARTRNGVRTTCATVLSGLTLAVVVSVFGVADQLPVILFGAATCFFGALLITHPHRGERARTFGWASVVAAVAIAVTVELNRTAVWAAASFLVVQMFLSYAVRSWSLRAGNIAVIGALTTFLTGAMHITTDRVWWFVLASTVGFAWIIVSEYLILPDDPVRSLKRSIDVFCRTTGDAVAGATDILTAGSASDRPTKVLRRRLDRVRRCRTAVDSRLSGALSIGFGPHDLEQLRVALYCTERGTEELVHQADDPRWVDVLPADIAETITSSLRDLADALRGDVDTQSLDSVASEAQRLRDHLFHDATSAVPMANTAPHRATALAALTAVGAAQLVAQSTSHATALITASPVPPVVAAPLSGTSTASTMTLAIQAALAAVLAGLIAKSVGNDQSLLVAWTAYVVIGASAEASTRRAWTWLAATVMGATAGVAIAASVPDSMVWTFAVVTVGVFFTIVTAATSYPAMVFWMNIALVPLFATEGLYLDLIRDKAVAAFIGGSVAAVVALTVAPIRLSRDLRPAVLAYLDALDAALAAQRPGNWDQRATAGAALDRAHSTLESMVATALDKTHLFPQAGNPLTEQAVRIGAVHEAFLRLTPTLTDSSRRLHGWTDRQVELNIRRLRDDVQDARVAAGGGLAAATSPPGDVRAEPAEALDFGDNLHARLAEFVHLLSGQPRSRAAAL